MCSACSSLTAITSLIGRGTACRWSGHGGLHNLIILVHWQAILKMSYGRCCDHKRFLLQSSVIPIPSAPARLFPPSQRYEPLEKYPNSPIPKVFPYSQFPLLFGNKRSWLHRVNLESLSLHSSLDFICADSRAESTVVLREMYQQSEESALPSGRSRRRGVRPSGAKGDNHWECEP